METRDDQVDDLGSTASEDEQDFDHMSDAEFMELYNSRTMEARQEAPAEDEPQLAAEPEGDIEDRLRIPGMEEDDEAAPAEAAADAAAAKAPAAAVAAENHTTPHQPAPAPADAAVAEAAPVNFEELYKKVMGPIKANGQTFTPASPEEAVRLMQMGANYTKKMQAMQPHLKLLRTLESKQLLSEERVNFLIDLAEKNPQAIQKLLHDSKIDPLDLDVTATPAYTPSNHTIGDDQMAFEDALSAVREDSDGEETIRQINAQWDQASKRELYQDPALLSVIHKQRSTGIYAKITAEMDRRRVLGELGNLPFIHAYKAVGDALHAAGRLNGDSGQAPASAVPAVAPAAVPPPSTRLNRPRTQAATREQVRAVSAAPGSTARSSRPASSFDPMTMSDAEIMAITSLR